MPRIVNFEGRRITVPDDATDDEVASIVGGGAPAAPVTSQALGFEQGVGNFLAHAAEPAIWAGKKLGADMSGFEQGQDIVRNPEHAPNEVPGKIGRFGADMIESAPLALAGPVAGGAASGAMTSDPGHEGTGALFGGLFGKGFQMLGNAIAPHVAPAVARLREAGVTMTPGQIFGGSGMGGDMVKGVEDRVAGLPIVGDWIRGAQARSLEDAGRGAINTSLAPVGQELPAGLIGQDAIRHAGDTLSGHYDALLPQATTTLDAPFSQVLQNAGNRVDARLPDTMGDQFQGTIADVFKKMNSTGSPQPSTYSGTAAHEAASDLGRMSRQYAGQGGDASELGQAYGQVDRGMRDAITRSNPQLGPEIRANDNGWANLVRLEDASKAATGNASGKAPGVFTGQQLRTAARAGDNSVRDRATARGDARMQQYAEDMIQVLPSSVGDSGSAGRMVLPLLAGGAATISAPAAAALAAIPAIYSRPVLTALNTIYARNPGAGATALGEMVQRLGAPASGAMSSQMGRK